MEKLSMGERIKIHAQRILKEREDFENHPEKYPYYVMGMVQWPAEVAHQYNITNIPIAWDEALFEVNHTAVVCIKEGETPAETRKVAQDLCIHMNTEEGRLPLMYEPEWKD